MYGIGIFGSCVSRDIFRISQLKVNINYYIARSSLISVVSKPINVQEEEINLSSEFQKRLVAYDFNKTFLRETIHSHVDYLIIDFIDERLNLLKYNDSYVTRSVELVNSKFEEMHNDFQMIKRDSADVKHLWQNSCDTFIKELKKKFAPQQIILHKAYWLTKYKDGNKVYDFPENMKKQIISNNKLLEQYYSYFEKEWYGVNSISLDKNSYYADKQHQWGLSPFHYEKEYYEQMNGQIHTIMNSISN